MGFTQICKKDETTYVSVGNRKISIPEQLSNYVTLALNLDVIIRMEIFHSDYLDDVNGNVVLVMITAKGKIIELYYHDDEDSIEDPIDYNQDNIQVREIPNAELTNRLELINVYIDTIRLCENSLRDFCSNREDSIMLWTKDHTDKLEKFLTIINSVIML
ncbi:MAG: hypothetical protein Terrestrivirus1_320 [Terrestrivirus sp.]|uniref:Uncharacterized protein n=1 Tax=Terrestrivirus sp. TaxID=2487775 RepID=A0A3G4ZKT3_9VIRU|nr:MAG: hypothetical protein Terrestrivirus1_320 [Terrestrivirus sp.]